MTSKKRLLSFLCFALAFTHVRAAELIYRGKEGEVRYYHATASVAMHAILDKNITRGMELPDVTTSLSEVGKSTIVLMTLPRDAIVHEMHRMKAEMSVEVDGKTLPLSPDAAKPVSPWDDPITVGMTPQGDIVCVYGPVEIIAARREAEAKAKQEKIEAARKQGIVIEPEPSKCESETWEWDALELEKAARQSYSSLFPIFPEKIVVKGESWTNRRRDVKMPGLSPEPLDLLYTYTYIGDTKLEGAKCAVVKTKMEFAPLDFEARRGAPPVNFTIPPDIVGVPTSLRLDSCKGKLYFDYREGRIRKHEETLKLTMGIRVPGDGKQVYGFRAQLKMTVKRTILLKKEP